MKQLLYRLRAALDAFKYPGTVRMEFDNETLGRFDTAVEAHDAYLSAKAAVHTHHDRMIGKLK